MGIPIDGRALGAAILNSVKSEIQETGLKPGLAACLVGSDPASRVYVDLKEKAAALVGINFTKVILPTNTPQAEIIAKINALNADPKVQAVLVQLPLPAPLDQNAVVAAIDPNKDVDAFSGNNGLMPPPVGAVLEALKSTKLNLAGKSAALRVNSQLFGMVLKNALTTLNIQSQVIQPGDNESMLVVADIAISARGTPHTVKNIKPGAIIIDIGTTRVDNRILGDFAPEALTQSGLYTPVPGGIGPLTVALLMKNTLALTKN